MELPKMDQNQFPSKLGLLADKDRVTETFGWTPMIIGLILLSSGILLLWEQPKDWKTAFSVAVIGSLFLVGSCLLCVDFWRRKNRFVFVPQEDRIAVYRNGLFSHSFIRVDVTFYQLQLFNTIRYLFVTLVVGFLGPLLFIAFDRISLVFYFQVALAFLLFSSVIYTRIFCYHYFVPRKRARYKKTVLLRKSIGNQLFGPNFP
jgi:hypothetical protein